MRRLIFSTLAISLLGVAAAWSAPPAQTDIEVMTQNQYVGANLFPIIPALKSGDSELINSTLVGVIKTISANRTFDRVRVLSGEILARKPHVVGIQEAWLIWCEPAGLPPCTNPEFAGAWGDHLALTEFALGGAYTKAAYIENFAFATDFYDSQGRKGTVMVIDRDATFVRKDVSFVARIPGTDYPCLDPFEAGRGCTFNVNTPIDFMGDPTPETYVYHGFLVVDATIAGKVYRFVNTHLENGYMDGFPGVIQSAQAVQILEALAGTPMDRKLIIVGDMNSDPSDAVDPESPIPATPYMLFAGAGLFDVWLYRPGDVLGLTCCQDEDLLNRQSMLTRRIDLILSREQPLRVKDARLIGEVAADRLGPPGRSLWPTDHASVAAGVKF
jgi:hypothetical protein